MSGNGKVPPRTDRVRTLAGKLYDLEDDEITETHIHLPPGATVETQRGRVRAVSVPDAEVTKPDHDKPESDPPKAAKWALALIRAVDNWPRALVAVAILVLAGLAIWKGVTGLPVANP